MYEIRLAARQTACWIPETQVTESTEDGMGQNTVMSGAEPGCRLGDTSHLEEAAVLLV